MKTAPETQFRQQIVHNYFVRFHMSLILTGVIASGVLISKLLLELHVYSMRLRYPIAILCSYVVFLLLVKIWIWYVCRVRSRSGGFGIVNLGNIDTVGGGGGQASEPFAFGGGTSGGGGASDSWDADVAPHASTSSIGSGSGGGSKSGGGGFDLDLGDDWAILLLLAALVLSIVIAGGYLIYVAPNLLPEVAWQALAASSLTGVSKRINHDAWLASVLRASAIPFCVVLVFAFALAWVAHQHCPDSAKLMDALHCVMK